jgi:hypothetical protein
MFHGKAFYTVTKPRSGEFSLTYVNVDEISVSSIKALKRKGPNSDKIFDRFLHDFCFDVT